MCCYLNAQGELICPTTLTPVALDPAVRAAVENAITALSASTLGQKRLALVKQLIEVIANSQLTDSCIGERTFDTVVSVTQLLAPEPPASLTFRFCSLGGDVLANWFTSRGHWVEASRVTQRWSNLQASCS